MSRYELFLRFTLKDQRDFPTRCLGLCLHMEMRANDVHKLYFKWPISIVNILLSNFILYVPRPRELSQTNGQTIDLRLIFRFRIINMFVYLYQFMLVRMHVCKHACMLQVCCMHSYMCVCMYAHTYILIHIHIHAYIHTYIHTYMHTYIYIYIRTYIHTCIHGRIHARNLRTAHTHTYIHTHSYIHTYL